MSGIFINLSISKSKAVKVSIEVSCNIEDHRLILSNPEYEYITILLIWPVAASF